MIGKIRKYGPPQTYTGDYFQYLRADTENVRFPPEIERELNSKAGIMKALDFGIRRELDAIMYYIETNNLVPETPHQIMDQIKEEERNHFVHLTIKGKSYLNQSSMKPPCLTADKREIENFSQIAFGNFVYPHAVIRNIIIKKGVFERCKFNKVAS